MNMDGKTLLHHAIDVRNLDLTTFLLLQQTQDHLRMQNVLDSKDQTLEQYIHDVEEPFKSKLVELIKTTS